VRIDRRQFVQGAGVAGLGLLAGCGPPAFKAEAPPSVRTIGFLGVARDPSAADGQTPELLAFREELSRLGYLEGQNLRIEWRQAPSRDGLPGFAADLVQLQVEVIVAAGVGSVRAAVEATTTIPVVMASIGSDPVAAGLVSSLARPGGNLTGPTQIYDELSAKRLELLREVAPASNRIAVLWDAGSPDKELELQASQRAAQALGLELQPVPVRNASELEGAFEAAREHRADALVVFEGFVILQQQARIAALATTARLPAMHPRREFVQDGGLLAYGANQLDSYRRAAHYIDKILRGAQPSDLPIERPLVFDFAINLKTAQALGLTIPPHVLLQATEVIQ
jgi:putative ABC transport system substrate-binding protein